MFLTLTESDSQNVIIYNNDSKIKLLTGRNHSKTYLEQDWEHPVCRHKFPVVDDKPMLEQGLV